MNRTSAKKARRNDLLLLAAFLVIGLIALFIQHISKENGARVVVHNGNQIYASFPLSEDTEYLIETPLGTNHLVIRDSIVCVDEADCANQLCVLQGAISQTGEMIVCLPHEIVVEIRNDN